MGANDDGAGYNWVPDGTPVAVVRNIINTQSCDNCHSALAMHGGRTTRWTSRRSDRDHLRADQRRGGSRAYCSRQRRLQQVSRRSGVPRRQPQERPDVRVLPPSETGGGQSGGKLELLHDDPPLPWRGSPLLGHPAELRPVPYRQLSVAAGEERPRADQPDAAGHQRLPLLPNETLSWQHAAANISTHGESCPVCHGAGKDLDVSKVPAQ